MADTNRVALNSFLDGMNTTGLYSVDLKTDGEITTTVLDHTRLWIKVLQEDTLNIVEADAAASEASAVARAALIVTLGSAGYDCDNSVEDYQLFFNDKERFGAEGFGLAGIEFTNSGGDVEHFYHIVEFYGL